MTAGKTADVERFVELVEELLGIECAPWQIERLPSLLRERAQKGRHADVATYLRSLSMAKRSSDELSALAEELTVGETYFFREPKQLDVMIAVAIPALLSNKRRSPGPLRILSAGCSSGEEAYSIALSLRHRADERTAAEAQIVGVDMNPAALQKAREAIYSSWSLRSTPDAVRDRWFSPKGQGARLRPEIGSMVKFERRNLLLDDPAFFRPGAFDIVFCRNVTIYFSPAATRKVVGALERSITPGGFLFLGHSETLRGLSDEFDLMQSHETFYYQKKDLARPGTVPRPNSPIGDPAAALSSAALPAEAPPELGMDAWMKAILRSSARIEAATKKLEETSSKDTPAPQAQLNKALELFQAERFDEALVLLRSSRDKGALGPLADILRAVICVNLGLFAEAEAACAPLRFDEARGASAHYILGLCCEHEGNPERAANHLRSAIHLDPTFAMPYIRLGRLARASGDIDEARATLRRAADLIARERPDRILLFGGGFQRSALLELCRAEIQACGEAS